MDTHYPSVDLAFFISLLENSSKVAGVLTEGTTKCFVINGTKPIGERIIIIREGATGVDYEYAVAIAYRMKKLSELMDWLEVNRNWKSGGYIVKP